MCGIAGILSLDGSVDLTDSIRKMTDVLVHRGPDDSGTMVDGRFALGFRRLSILDLEPTGHQPMTTLDGSCTIVFNGEIYNYIELREKLVAKGYRFRSSGDTEVLLNAYCEWGEDCLSMLNGMWAFLILDRRRQVLFGSRDRFGIKPLYMHRRNGTVLFASEIKAIRASGMYRTEIDWATAGDFLVRKKLEHGDSTFFSGIEQIPAGGCFSLSADGKMSSRRFWSLPEVSRSDESSVISEYSELFEDSIRLHRRSDVPLAVFLSGGVDSTSIICSLARLRQGGPEAAEPLKALSFMDPEFDETEYIEDTLRQTSAELERVDYSAKDIWRDLPKVLWYHDEPVHSTTALIGFRLSQVAASHGIKVILNGQGADETGAGYARYFNGYWRTILAEQGIAALRRELRAYTSVRGGSDIRLLLGVVSRRVSSQIYRARAYRAFRKRTALMQDREHAWFTDDFLEKLRPQSPGGPDDVYLDRQLRESVTDSPLPLYLRIEDRNAMAHSVEIRVPFLDYRLVELLFQSPATFKMRGPYNKYIVREAMKGKIPDSVLDRYSKMGFPSPADAWMSELGGDIRDLLNSPHASDSGILDIENIRRDFDRHCKGEASIGQDIFRILQFMIWHRDIASASPANVAAGPVI